MRRATRPTGALRSLRERNRDLVVSVLRREGTASRAEIARLTGLSRATVSSLIADLQADGLVAEATVTDERPRSQGGRPGVPLALQPSAGSAVGVDFGRTHVSVAVSDLASRVLREERRELDVDAEGPAAIETAAALVEGVVGGAGIDRSGIVGVGMGVPAPIDRRTGTVASPTVLRGWAGLRPAEELGRRLGLAVEVENDANLGALGEHSVGAARASRDLIYLKVGTGIGAGIVLDGRLHRGATGLAGEIGHIIVDPEGAVCHCGNRGCLETVAALPALVRVLRGAHGGDFSVADLRAASAAGDLASRRILTDAGRSIGRVLAALVNALNPSLIVVGGTAGVATPPLLDGIRESVGLFALAASGEAVAVTRSELGERAALSGALALVISQSTPRISASPQYKEEHCP